MSFKRLLIMTLFAISLFNVALLADIGLEANDTLNKYKADTKYISYGFKTDFGVKLPEEKPFFILPISSVAHLNT